MIRTIRPIYQFKILSRLMTGYIFLPLLFYFGGFFILTFPLLLKFNSMVFANFGDGMQNYWNLWWINKAVTQLHTSIWYTDYLHFPEGVTLAGHTLNSFNGFLGIIFLRFFNPEQTYNAVMVFSFVFGGLTAFWLAFYLSKNYYGALLSGFIFTFSEYHFAHAEGHLQLVALEWIPLFVLCFFRLLRKPTILKGFWAAAAISLVFFCDYYYFLYCIMTALIMTGWKLVKDTDFKNDIKKLFIPLVVFLLGTAVFTGPVIIDFFNQNRRDPFLGGHSVREFSMDLLAPFIPGGHWRFSELTKNFWQGHLGNIHETSVYLGWPVILVAIYTVRKKLWKKYPPLLLLYLITLIFAVLSLGPRLFINNQEIAGLRLPYSILNIIPGFSISGVPLRMMVMATLGAAVIFSFGIENFFKKINRRLAVGVLLLTILFIEYLPTPIPTTKLTVPLYIERLKNLPGKEGVIDTVSTTGSESLYFQTIYEKPLISGYLARTPSSVEQRDKERLALLKRGDFKALVNLGFRYLIAKKYSLFFGICKTIIEDKGIGVFDLRTCKT